VCEEVFYRDTIPKSFESREIRVYVTQKEKRGLVNFVFSRWYDRHRNLAGEERGLTA
jgi:hypothetical protein